MAGMDPVDFVRGDATGLHIPAHPKALADAGPAFLTAAFRAFGALEADNAVTRIAAIEPCPGGSTGAKLFLTLDYARAAPGLPAGLFVKFSRDFTDPRRDEQRGELEAEARFAAVTRMPGFPIAVPVAMFADYHRASGTGLIVTERIRFGEGGIEPHRRKCLDYETLGDALPYYRALVSALARLAASHKAGRLGPDIEALFPFDPVAASSDPISYDEAALDVVIARARDFAERAPQLLPPEIRTPEFHAKLAREAHAIRVHEPAIQAYLRGNRDLVALCHWNAHIDNAWFRRDAAGLHCGLIDWGRVGQISFGSALWGCLSAARHDVWDDHLDALLALFVGEYHAHGGPCITTDELELHLLLHVAAMGVSRVLAFPKIIEQCLPDAAKVPGPRDPVFHSNDPARNLLHVYTMFLKLWRRRDFGAALDRVLAR